MTRRLAVAGMLTWVMSFGSAAQTRPDFSGTWVRDEQRRHDLGSRDVSLSFADPFTVKQDDKTLTLVDRDGARRLAVALDGSATNSQRADGAGVTWTAAWSGPKLVVTARWGKTQTTRTIWIEDGLLIIQVEEHFFDGPFARFTYRKATHEWPLELRHPGPQGPPYEEGPNRVIYC